METLVQLKFVQGHLAEDMILARQNFISLKYRIQVFILDFTNNLIPVFILKTQCYRNVFISSCTCNRRVILVGLQWPQTLMILGNKLGLYRMVMNVEQQMYQEYILEYQVRKTRSFEIYLLYKNCKLKVENIQPFVTLDFRTNVQYQILNKNHSLYLWNLKALKVSNVIRCSILTIILCRKLV